MIKIAAAKSLILRL